jgi:protocatechuate 3,4-dioxygenase beta subunit
MSRRHLPDDLIPLRALRGDAVHAPGAAVDPGPASATSGPPRADRRRLLRLLPAGALGVAGTAGGLGLAGLLGGCGGAGTESGDALSDSSSGSSSSGSTSSGSVSAGTVSSCSTQPTETNGPYPADGTRASNQTLNALALSGIVRQDIRSSVGSASGTAAGIPLTLNLRLVNVGSSCADLSGYAVYIWHCTRDGLYSLYSSGLTGQNYLRGVQVSDSAGALSFTTVFPGCYSGRWPHIHFEVYRSLSAATDAGSTGDWALVSQIALPEAVCRTVYGQASGYTGSLSALNGITLASDNVFSDGYASQMATVTGDLSSGYTAELVIGLASA